MAGRVAVPRRVGRLKSAFNTVKRPAKPTQCLADPILTYRFCRPLESLYTTGQQRTENTPLDEAVGRHERAARPPRGNPINKGSEVYRVAVSAFSENMSFSAIRI